MLRSGSEWQVFGDSLATWGIDSQNCFKHQNRCEVHFRNVAMISSFLQFMVVILEGKPVIKHCSSWGLGMHIWVQPSEAPPSLLEGSRYKTSTQFRVIYKVDDVRI